MRCSGATLAIGCKVGMHFHLTPRGDVAAQAAQSTGMVAC
jgi:hypothetical protein